MFRKREIVRYVGRADSIWEVNIMIDFMGIVWGVGRLKWIEVAQDGNQCWA